MNPLEIRERPPLRNPVLIAAFAGWNDAGGSATSAIRFLLRRWRPAVLAEIDPEPFYDFTQARPQVRLEQGERVIDWPSNKFYAHRVEGQERDVILLQGTEPHLGWQSYLGAVSALCHEFGVTTLVTLGALLAEVSHTRPVHVTGSSPDGDLAQRLGLSGTTSSRYEGPTGIVGVLSQAARAERMETASIWASVPIYLDASPNPKGALALLERLNRGFGLSLTLHDLEVYCARFDAQVAAAVASDPRMAEYARRIEEQSADAEEEAAEAAPPAAADELPDAQTMVDELERFLREQRGGNV